MSKIAASFFFRLLSSFILAVIVWLVISTTYVNPPDSGSIPVPLSLVQRSALDNMGLELRTESFRNYVEISYKCRKEDLEKITQANFEAYIDFSNVTGVDVTSLPVEIKTSNTDNISITKVEPATIPIAVEKRISKPFDVQVQFNGELADGFILTGYTCFPSTRSFTARESMVNQIAHVDVDVDLSGLAGNTIMHQECRVVNGDGKEITMVGWEQVVDISLEISKEVQVVPNVIGSLEDDYYVRYIITTPETVRINGTKDALEQVDSLYTDTIDIGRSRQSVSQERALQLPKNIKMSQDALPRATVDVTIYRYQYTQNVALSKGRIDFINASDAYRYEIVESEIPLILKGKVDDIANLTQDQVSAVVDVSELTIGTHAVPAIVTLPDGITNVNDVMLTMIVARK